MITSLPGAANTLPVIRNTLYEKGFFMRENRRVLYTSRILDETKWWSLGAALAFINPLRGPGIAVAILAALVEEVGQDQAWYTLLLITFANLLVIRFISLVVMDIACVCLDLFFELRGGSRQRTQRNIGKKMPKQI
jgi:hypothetical protein